MDTLLRNLRSRRLAPAAFLTFWIAAWALTVLTWQQDVAGYSIGMAFIALPLHLILPVLLGALVTLSMKAPQAGYVKRCSFIGLAFGLLQFGILALVDYFWLPAPEVGQSLTDLVAGTMVGAILYGLYSAVLGVLGGWLTASLWSVVKGSAPRLQ